jgi:diguanylate cyclase (GGDEF)-like protein
VEHTYLVKATINDVSLDIFELQAGEHGYILTGQEVFLKPYYMARDKIGTDIQNLRVLTEDNPSQQKRLDALESLVKQDLEFVADIINIRQFQGLNAAAEMINKGRGVQLTDAIRTILNDMNTEETSLLEQRASQTMSSVNLTRWMVGMGTLVALLATAVSGLFIANSITHPLKVLVDGTTEIKDGNLAHRVEVHTRDEIGDLAASFNQMAGQVQETSTSYQRANEELALVIRQVQQRNREVELVNEMSEVLQICQDLDEAYAMIGRYAAKFLPQEKGILYQLAPSRDVLETGATWGDGDLVFKKVITPDDCWALRRGQVHIINEPLTDLICPHISTDEIMLTSAICIPLLASGDVIGMLHICNQTKENPLTVERQQIMTSFAEHLSLSLSNLKLRETLRQQSIRDALTGLYNRRFLEETLGREILRARRANITLSLMMLDVDHFKRFNDTFGHQAGDLVLSNLGRIMQANVRGEDLACRYGGEEFIIVLPGASLQVTQERAELLRQEVEALSVYMNDQHLGPVTVSIGLSCLPENGTAVDMLIRAADAALYQAKQSGRNLVKIADGLHQ